MLFDIFEILICYDFSVFWYLKGCFRYIILFFLLFIFFCIAKVQYDSNHFRECYTLFLFFCNLLTIKLLFSKSLNIYYYFLKDLCSIFA